MLRRDVQVRLLLTHGVMTPASRKEILRRLQKAVTTQLSDDWDVVYNMLAERVQDLNHE